MDSLLQEIKTQVQFMTVPMEKEGWAFVTMSNENNVLQENLMRIMQKHNCFIQKYYWRSLYDPTYIEYMKPKVYDVFSFHVDFGGQMENLKSAWGEFAQLHKTVKKLKGLEI